jgi:hypothetical protein
MGKLTLDLDQLTVDSFDTAAPAAKKGTVFGEQECTCPTACQTACTCPGCPTCDYSECGPQSCGGTCAPAYTCDYSVTAGGYGYCECCPL